MQTVKAKVIPEDLLEIRAASTASGGTALSTTAAYISIPLGADYVSITPRNFAGAAVARVLLNPHLAIFYTTDGGGSITDISDEMQDGDTTDVAIDSFPATGTGYIYVGAPVQFAGVVVDVGTGAQGTASVITVKYWNGVNWTDISDTDGTTSGGASFAVDGSVTWTVPTAWAKASLTSIGDTLPAHANRDAMYWTRWEWSVAFDSDTDVAQMRAINRSTSYAELLEGQTLDVGLQKRRLSTIQALTDAGTANLVVNVASVSPEAFE